jgi:hypothetical protein
MISSYVGFDSCCSGPFGHRNEPSGFIKGGPISRLAELLKTDWHTPLICVCMTLHMPSFSRPVHTAKEASHREARVRTQVGFSVDKVALGQGCLLVLQFSCKYHSTVTLHLTWGTNNKPGGG